MSHRSLIEINHDFCPREEDIVENLAQQIVLFIQCGEAAYLPDGWKLIATRHHSEPEFELKERP